MNKLVCLITLYFVFASTNVAANAAATSLKDYLQKTEVSGDVRSYYFLRNFGVLEPHNQWGYSLGGALNLRSADLYGFRGGLSYYAADDLGFVAGSRAQRDRTLPAGNLNVLGQAYLQYEKHQWLLRAGDQWIDTPWLNQADSRMIPALYQGAVIEYKPLQPVTLALLRVLEYKNRTSHEFNKTNLYTANVPGGTPVPALFNVDVIGALAAGAKYNLEPVRVDVWYYKFYNFANLLYADAEYVFKNSTHFDPLLAAQVAGEWSDGKSYLEVAHLGFTQSMVYGVLVGMEVQGGRFSLSYNAMPVRPRAYRAGDLISPYTSGYQSDPLYTTSMNAGLVEKAAGHGVKLDGVYHFFDEQLRTELSYAKYYTARIVHNTSEVDMDVTYLFKHGDFKNLSLRNRLGILNGDPNRGRYLYYRFMVDYSF